MSDVAYSAEPRVEKNLDVKQGSVNEMNPMRKKKKKLELTRTNRTYED